MISFRFHIVSITAIFLAIAIGVVVGSTYVDGATVDAAPQSDPTPSRATSTEAQGRERPPRGRAGARRGQYIELSAEFAVTDRLTDVPCCSLAARGVDEDAVERTVALARQRRRRRARHRVARAPLGARGRRGARRPGVDRRWLAVRRPRGPLGRRLAGGGRRGRCRGDSGAEPRGRAGGVDPGATGSVLGDLEAAGFLTVDSLDDDTVSVDGPGGAAPRMLFITGAARDRGGRAGRARGGGGERRPEAGDAWSATSTCDAPEAPGRRGAWSPSRSTRPCCDAIVIVDDADLEAGRVAVGAGARRSAADGQVGLHYGYGDGADAVLPGVDARRDPAPEGAATSLLAIGRRHGRGRRRVARLRRRSAWWSSRPCSARPTSATPSRRRTACPTCSSSCSPPARCRPCWCPPSSTTSAAARAPRRRGGRRLAVDRVGRASAW